MSNPFSRQAKEYRDQELFHVAKNPAKYVPEMVSATIHELEARGHDTSQYLSNIEKYREQAVKESKPHHLKSKSRPAFRFLKSFFRFIMHPDVHQISTSVSSRLLLTLRFYFNGLLLLFITTIPVLVLEEYGNIQSPKQRSIIPEYFQSEIDIIISSLLIPVIASTIEESQFRLVLTKFNKKYFDVFISFFGGSILLRFFGYPLISYSDFYYVYLIQISFIHLILAATMYFGLSRVRVHSTWFESNWNKTYVKLFHVLAVLFAIGHLPDFEFTVNHVLFLPLIALPFLTYAYIFSYVRVRVGFRYAVLLHFFIDLAVILRSDLI